MPGVLMDWRASRGGSIIMVLMLSALEKRRAIVEAAESQLGVAEEPRGSHRNAEIRAYLEATRYCHDWSTAFVDWAWHRATGSPPPWGRSMTQPHNVVRWAMKNGHWLRENDPRDTAFARGEPLAGDVLVIGDLTEPFLSRGEHYCHLGLVEQADHATVVTIEGDHHGMVARTRHSRVFDGINRFIAGYIRLVPLDDSTPVQEPPPVSVVPHTIEDMAHHRLVVDLDHLSTNHDLVRQVQVRLAHLGLIPLGEVDGVLGPRTHAALRRFCMAARLNSMEVRRFGPAFAHKLIGMRVIPPHPLDYTPHALGTVPAALRTAVDFTVQWEEPSIDHPAERGVVMSRGITQMEYDEYRLHFSDPTRPVQFMEQREMLDIFHYLYWGPLCTDDMAPTLATVLFDTAVSMGPGAVPLLLQETLGLVVDGVMGSTTQEAMHRLDAKDLALRLIDARGAYRYQRLEDEPSQGAFLHDWLGRDNGLRRFLD